MTTICECVQDIYTYEGNANVHKLTEPNVEMNLVVMNTHMYLRAFQNITLKMLSYI